MISPPANNKRGEKIMNKLTSAKLISMVILLILVSLLVGWSTTTVAAGENAKTPSRDVLSVPLPQGPTDPADLEAFWDEYMEKTMEELHIAGAAVSIVKDGELFFTKGYGYADLENGIPVDPEQTGFRIGSTTKLFTWTAVMQLYEQGKLNLDADVNSYIDFKIPDTYSEPITLKHLLTHTSGLEQRWYEFLIHDPDDMIPAGEFLASHIPTRVRPPCELAGYSNYNTNLAGYIVARVSDMPYDQYIQENILEPLGMKYTTVAAVPSPEMEKLQSVGYTYQEGTFQVYPDYWAQPGTVPSAGAQASAGDMGRFMIAHLQDGRYSDENIADTRILEEATTQQMHSTLFTYDPRLMGITYGFIENSHNGQRTIGHYGGSLEMNSGLLLLPDQNMGLFVAFNSTGGAEVTTQHLGFMDAFYDHFYPAPEVESIEPPADFSERAGRFTGTYRTTAGAITTSEKFMAQEFTISDPGDDTLLFSTPHFGDYQFVEMAPLFFREVDGELVMVFGEDDRGRITHMVFDLAPMWSFEKMNWYETLSFTLVMFGVCLLIFLSLIITLLIGSIRDRLQGRGRQSLPGGVKTARWIAVGICILNIVFVPATMQTGSPINLFGISLIYRLVLGLPVLAAVLTVSALVYTVLAWKDSYWGVVGRAHYTLVTLAALAFIWVLNIQNMLGWKF
jgi:CubicO group peptidase (beta-lactamase class C family)